MPVKPQWRTFILISETSTNNTCVTYSLPFSPSFPLALVLVATFYHNFIPITKMARGSLMMML